MPVTRDRRYTRDRPCPICGGYDRAPRGKGVRCFGYLSDDGAWAHCTREEHAGGIQPSDTSGAYPHRLAGPCKCGRQHGARTVMGGSAYQTTATYDYRGPEGDLLFQVLRKVPPLTGEKAFVQRRPDPSSSTGWTWNLRGVERVLYRLPELQRADPQQPVFLVEGEKDVDRLLQVGLVATTNPGGAGKWAKHYVRWLKGRHVVVIPDNDDASTRPPYAGQLHANEVARAREERLQQMLQLRQAGVSGSEIARRLGISEPRVVQILREFRATPPPSRAREFEERAFALLPQVESLRRDASEENIRLTEPMLQNLAEEAGAHIELLPEFPRQEMEEERWRVAFVRQQLLRALDDMETFRACQVEMREAQAIGLPRVVEQAQQCIDRAGQPLPGGEVPVHCPSTGSPTSALASVDTRLSGGDFPDRPLSSAGA